MSIKEFDTLFGLKTSIEVEKARFVSRIENTLFYEWDEHARLQHDAKIFRGVCIHLGEDATRIINFYGRIPKLNVLTEKEFVRTLRVIVALYEYFSENVSISRIIETQILNAFEKANLNLGVKWVDSVFYPTGDELLDKELIDTSFSLLDNFPNEKLDLKHALENYNSNSSYGVIENCYKAIEGLGRQLLNNKKTLDNNKEELLQLLQFSKYWDKIFINYLSYAHEYSRHAGEKRHELKPEEVEGFLYLTCLIIRATIRAYNER